MKITEFTIWLLGLEAPIFDKIDNEERFKYNRVSYSFLLLIGIAAISIYKFFEMVVSDILFSVLLTIIFSLVAFAMYRFSMITFRRSVYDPEPIQVNEWQASSIEKTVLKTKVFGSFLSSMSLRFLIFLPLSILIVFGFCSYFEKSTIDQICREKYLFDKNEQINAVNDKYSKSKYTIDLKIVDLNTDIYRLKKLDDQTDLMNQKITAVNLLHQQKQSDSTQFTAEIGRISNSNGPIPIYLMLVFDKFIHEALFWILLIVYLVFFIRVHFILYSLKTDSRCTYSILSTRFYKEIISENYQQFLREKETHLNHQTNLFNKEKLLDTVWEDAPFCSEYKLKYQPKSMVPVVNLPDALNTDSINA
jgi:hypothetical protein